MKNRESKKRRTGVRRITVAFHLAGIFAAFDDRAIQVIEACRTSAISIPEEVAIIGVDNDEMLCTNTTPPLSSAQQDHDRMGYLLALPRTAAHVHRRRHPPRPARRGPPPA